MSICIINHGPTTITSLQILTTNEITLKVRPLRPLGMYPQFLVQTLGQKRNHFIFSLDRLRCTEGIKVSIFFYFNVKLYLFHLHIDLKLSWINLYLNRRWEKRRGYGIVCQWSSDSRHIPWKRSSTYIVSWNRCGRFRKLPGLPSNLYNFGFIRRSST